MIAPKLASTANDIWLQSRRGKVLGGNIRKGSTGTMNRGPHVQPACHEINTFACSIQAIRKRLKLRTPSGRANRRNRGTTRTERTDVGTNQSSPRVGSPRI